MTWGNAEREHFFGTVTNDSDERFSGHYCSSRTRARLSEGGVSARTARRVIARIAEIAPYGDHTTPGWRNDQPLPVIVVGRGNLQSRPKWRQSFPGDVPDQKWTLVVGRPRFGLCTHENHLHLWADEEEVLRVDAQPGLSAAFWEVWRAEGTGKRRQFRYVTPLDFDKQILQDHPLHDTHPLVELIGGIAQRFRAPDERLPGVTAQTRIELDEPEGFSVIYPCLFEEDNGDGGGPNMENTPGGQADLQGTPAPPSGAKRSKQRRPTEVALPAAGISSADSMLKVLRDLAIARVRQVIGSFDESRLNDWILSTGYAGAVSPHSDTADLFVVYAASLTNAGGAKPDPDAFGEMIGSMVRQRLVGNTVGDAPDLRELAAACQVLTRERTLGGLFDQDIARIADGLPSPRPLMLGLLGSVLLFWNWLRRHHQGRADVMHRTFSHEFTAEEVPSKEVFGVLHELDGLPWMGIATAANFIKDSQVPGLREMKLSPADTANRLAGWFVKPDLHVSRLMAYITGRHTTHDLRQLKQNQALMAFLGEPRPNFQGSSPLQQGSLEMQVIADVHEWAVAAGTAPLEIDRLLYLIGVRETKVEGVSVSVPWYPSFMSEVDAALARGVPRKS